MQTLYDRLRTEIGTLQNTGSVSDALKLYDFSKGNIHLSQEKIHSAQTYLQDLPSAKKSEVYREMKSLVGKFADDDFLRAHFSMAASYFLHNFIIRQE